MNDTNSDELQSIWAYAMPLRDFIESCARDLYLGPGTFTRAHHEALEYVVNAAVAGDLIAYGRPPDEHRIERISPDQWIDAEIDDEEISVHRSDYGTFTSVRVVETDRPTVPNSVPPATASKERQKVGRPSQASAIRASIEHEANADSGWFNRPPAERFRAYKSYLSQLGFQPYRDQGFSDKTLQKYEREIRNKAAS